MTNETPTGSHRLTFLASAAVVVCLIAAAVLLTLKGIDPAVTGGLLAAVMAVAAPVLANLQHTQTQTQVIEKIDHQTNGVLTARIEEGVRRVLDSPVDYFPTEDQDRVE